MNYYLCNHCASTNSIYCENTLSCLKIVLHESIDDNNHLNKECCVPVAIRQSYDECSWLIRHRITYILHANYINEDE